MIPQAALLQKEGQSFCFVPNGDTSSPIAVEILASGTEGVVVEGLTSDKVIIAKPDILLKLLAGVPITVRE